VELLTGEPRQDDGELEAGIGGGLGADLGGPGSFKRSWGFRSFWSHLVRGRKVFRLRRGRLFWWLIG
jgi:hypothetical protein